MLEVSDIHTYYGKSYVLQGVSMNVQRGEAVAIMGRNGMGKSTIIRSIIGFNPPSRGQIIFKGIDITHLPTYKIARAGIGIVHQERLIFSRLSVRENLQIATRMREGGWDIERVLSLFPMLRERLDHKGNELSGGEQQMLGTARGLVGNPDLLILDEPTEGLGPVLVRETTQVLAQLKATGLSILFVEPNLGVVRKLADRVYVVNNGIIVHESTPEEVLQNTEVKSQYLGM